MKLYEIKKILKAVVLVGEDQLEKTITGGGGRHIVFLYHEEFTSSKETGGILFGSKAACPKCAPGIEKRAKEFGEEKHIKARCPDGMGFAEWVRGLR